MCVCVWFGNVFFVSFPIVYEGNPVPRKKTKNKTEKNESAGTYQEHMNDMKSYYREILVR